MCSLSVLVVDDEPYSAEAMAELLRLDGHSALTARDGREALAQVPAIPFHLVISDLMLPGMAGDGVIAALRKQGRPACWYVLMSSFRADSIAGRADGCHRFIRKPLTVEALQNLVNDCIADPWIAARFVTSSSG